ncbi:hypothetical protein G6F59_016362 [Rhizopus arrhizus]|nr:hypothetical protein G6F59_016362 [Rhizopus arrhizus]
MDASVQQTAGMQSFFFSPSKVVFYRYYAIYELSLRAAVIKFISFDPENSGASITVIRFYVGQLPGPESPCIVSFTYSAAARGFQPVTGEQGFEYIYIPRSRKMTYTEARRRLGRLGVDTWRVLDVSFPAHSVVGP